MMSVLPTLLQPPPTAEELALKEQVTQKLASQGVLAKLKAELRAAVFDVMYEREDFVRKRVSTAPQLDDFPRETRTIALSLIVECLEYFHWEHALHVLLAETSHEQQHDSVVLAEKIGLTSISSSTKPLLFQLIESRRLGGDQPAVPVSSAKHDQSDDDNDDDCDHLSRSDDALALKSTTWEQEESAQPLALKEPEHTEKEAEEEAKDYHQESSAEIDESMAEEVPSGSELEESSLPRYEEESRDDDVKRSHQATTTLYSTRLQEEYKARDDSNNKDDHKSDDEEAVSFSEPPPAPAKLPALPSLINASIGSTGGNTEDDFDAEEEAERLRKLDATLQAMEAEDDTGTLQQLKVSLQMELQEQDSFMSSSGLVKAMKNENGEEETEAEDSKSNENDQEDEDGYGSSDFEEEEEVASDISESMESMEELSDESAAVSTAEVEPSHVLQNDTRVDNEDALNSYDYIEDVEK